MDKTEGVICREPCAVLSRVHPGVVGEGDGRLERVAYREWRPENSQVIAPEPAERVTGAPTACRGRAVEEPLQTRWRNHDEKTDGFVAAPLPRVRHPARNEYERASRRFLDLVGKPHAKCAVEHIDHFIERVMDVIRRPLARRVHSLEHRQRSARLRAASFEHDLSAERVFDAFAASQRKKNWVFRHMRLVTQSLLSRVAGVVLRKGGG